MYSTPLISRMPPDMPSVYYEEEFRYTLEQYLPRLRKSEGTISFDLTPREKAVFHGNFIGLLLERSIPTYLHWIIMRLNDIDSSYDFNGELDSILIPDNEALDRIREQYQTVHRI